VAVELARRLANRFDDGVRLVELASLVDPVQLPGAVAAALGVREQPGRSMTQSLQTVSLALVGCTDVHTPTPIAMRRYSGA